MRRRTALRLCGWAAAVAVVLTGLSVAYPGGLGGFVADVCCYEQNAEQLEEQQSSGRDLDVAIKARADRAELLDELGDGLIAGTVRLREAADFYLSVVRGDPDFFRRYRDHLPGATDVERMAVALLRAAFFSPHSESARRSLLARFHAEFGVEYPLPIPPPVGNEFTAVHTSHP